MKQQDTINTSILTTINNLNEIERVLNETLLKKTQKQRILDKNKVSINR